MGFKPKEIVVQSVDDFQEMIDEKDFIIAESIVEGILANLENPKKNIHLLSIVCTEEESIYDITVEKQHFATTLEENLAHYVREERYEECQIIADTISELKGKQLSNLIYQISGSK
jgi:hypothetical protein